MDSDPADVVRKRKPDEHDETGNGHKVARLEDDKIAAMPSGANYVESDGKACTHEVVWPPDVDGSTLPPAKRAGPSAKEYPFRLDPFQQTAINCLEAGHSVLVAAHTSAGKTVVAQYAFAMALRDKTRVVYTSPLKALSNQKYRELYEEFQDVGLMTGDVTINPTASCLVMTTEILRSMLYRGSEVVREVSLVVYDEIHYLRDKERGVVWEESIILMPPTARFAFLSATIPNAREFAGWIARVHASPCHVVYTDYRPVPLQHYVFPSGGEGLFMVVDERGTFREDNFQKAVAVLTDTAPSTSRQATKKEKAESENSDTMRIVKMIMERQYDPVIVFSFSKKECEALACSLVNLDLTDEDEKKLIDQIYTSAMDALSVDDQRLPQISNMLPMLRRGVGVHHSGLLPIVKEVIEILFQEGLLKVLFATETFSTGLNMPAKTVVFASVRKFDGGSFRWVSSGEYIQMSGRAGRRGLDDRGIVILMLDSKMEPAVARSMLKGAPDTLYSEFQLRYTMLLNLMRMEGAAPEELMRQSYRQFQMERALPDLQAKVESLREERDSIVVPDEEETGSFLALLEQLAELRSQLRALLQAPQYSLPFLQPGRLVRVLPDTPDVLPQLPSFRDLPEDPPEPSTSGSPGGRLAAAVSSAGSVWGAVVNFERVGRKDGEAEGPRDVKRAKAHSFMVDVLINCDPDTVGGSGPRKKVRLLPPGARGTAMVVSIPLTQVDVLSSVRIHIARDLRPTDARQSGVRALAEALVRLGKQMGKVPLLDPEEDLKVESKGLRKLVGKVESVEALLTRHTLASARDLQERLALMQRKAGVEAAVKAARREAKAAQSLVLRDELKARQRVLRRLGYVDGEGVVTLKGRTAAEISSGDELVLAELIFGGAFNSMPPHMLAATCSCFVWQEKAGISAGKTGEDMQAALASVREAARRVGKVALECKVDVDLDEYVESFRPELMEIVAAWVKGAKFSEIARMAEVYEGSLVRAIRRLEELLRQCAVALTSMGDIALAGQFEEAISKMKRDIIFAASLYL